MTRTHWAVGAAGLATLMASAGAAFGAPADVDRGFGADGRVRIDGGAEDHVAALAVQPDGKIVIAGRTSANGDDALVMRLNPDGTPDRGFDGDGVVTINRGAAEEAAAAAVQADGKIVVAGSTSAGLNGVVYRLNSNGSPDLGFGDQGTAVLDSAGEEHAFALAIQPGDGKIVVAGSTTVNGDMAVYRLTAQGLPDKSFDLDGARGIDGGHDEYARAVAIQPDGKVVVAGFSTATGQQPASLVARLNENGSPDTSFDDAGIARGSREVANALALQPDGKIVIAGIATDRQDALVYRLDPGGAPDKTFGGDGRVVLDIGYYEQAWALALQPNGKILVAGSTSVGSDAVVWRLGDDGSRDEAFAGNGELTPAGGGIESADAIALQPDGKIVFAGTRRALDDDALVFRLLGDSRPAEDPGGRPQGPEGGDPGEDTTPPRLTRLRVVPGRLGAGSRLARLAAPSVRAGRARAEIRFSLSEAARVRFVLRRGPRVVDAFAVSGHRGANRMRFHGRLAANRRLRPGRYSLTAVPRDPAGNGGRARRAAFRLLTARGGAR